jgi:hypothetical protein
VTASNNTLKYTILSLVKQAKKRLLKAMTKSMEGFADMQNEPSLRVVKQLTSEGGTQG